MNFTDACVFPYPTGDSSIRRMAIEACDLGFDSIVAINSTNCKYAGISVINGVFLNDTPVQDIISKVKRAKVTDNLIFVKTRDNRFNRAVIGIRGVHILYGLHLTDGYAFDHVVAKMAADSGIAIDLNLSHLINERGQSRQHVLNRYIDVVNLYRRFEFPIVLSTHAHSVLELRSVRDFSALATLFGFDIQDVEKALGNIGRIKSLESAVREIK